MNIFKIVAIFFIVRISFFSFQLYGQDCNPDISPVADERSKYKPRSNSSRCEGYYTSPMSGSFDVVSLTRGNFNFKLSRDEIISVFNESADELTVRGMAYDIFTYYRMDSDLKATDRLNWPVNDVLFEAGLDATKIGVVGLLSQHDSIFFVPVRVSSSLVVASTENYIKISLRSCEYVNDVTYSIGRIANGNLGTLSKPQKIVRSSAPGEKISFVLDKPLPGTYYCEIQWRSHANEQEEMDFFIKI